MRFGQRLSLLGPRPSVGSVGDAYDNALAETTIGLYKNECIRADSPFRRGPLRTLSDVELITADYVAWYNQQPSHAPPRPCPTHRSRSPLLFRTRDRPTGRLTEPRGCMKLGMVHMPLFNHWWQVTLYVSPRGLTTGAVPYRDAVFDIEFDFVNHVLAIRHE